MGKRVTTHLTVVSVNELTDEMADHLVRANDVDSIEEIAEGMEDQVAAIVSNELFAEADEIPILDVRTEVEDTDSVSMDASAKTASEEVEWADE